MILLLYHIIFTSRFFQSIAVRSFYTKHKRQMEDYFSASASQYTTIRTAETASKAPRSSTTNRAYSSTAQEISTSCLLAELEIFPAGRRETPSADIERRAILAETFGKLSTSQSRGIAVYYERSGNCLPSRGSSISLAAHEIYSFASLSTAAYHEWI